MTQHPPDLPEEPPIEAEEPLEPATPDLDLGPEEPDADVLEQHLPSDPAGEAEEEDEPADVPLEASEGDVLDQHRAVPVEPSDQD
ncbi:hypothetical protein [Actinopolymorpha pittospori]